MRKLRAAPITMSCKSVRVARKGVELEELRDVGNNCVYVESQSF